MRFELAVRAVDRAISDVEDRIKLFRDHPGMATAQEKLDEDLKAAARMLVTLAESDLNEEQIKFLLGKRAVETLKEAVSLFEADAGLEAQGKGIDMIRKFYAELVSKEG